MIHYLKGKIGDKNDRFVAIEVAGVGYKVFCSPGTLKKIAQGNEVKLYTFLVSKEETSELYGFLNAAELELFETLNEISGIGPKTALLLASLGSLETLKQTIEKGELPPDIKGIGQKKAQKILLELTGKIKEITKPPQGTKEKDEALDALLSLGFSSQRAKEALSQVSDEIKDPERRMKEALKFLGK